MASGEVGCTFLEIALRSTYEVMTAMDIAHGLEYLSTERTDILLAEADEIAAMIVGLMKSLGWEKATRPA